jgi:kumamolisin
MRPSRNGYRTLAGAALVMVLVAACPSGGTPISRGSNDAPARSQGGGDRAGGPMRFSRFLGPADPAQRMQFSVVLKVPRQAALERYVSGVNDPTSPLYRHFLDAGSFGRRFGLSPKDILRAERVLRAGGLRVVRTFPQRTAIDLAGPASAVSGVFKVPMGEFVDRTGRHFNAPLSDPVIPEALRDVITAVAGLNTGPVPAPMDVPPGGLKPVNVAKAYDIESLSSQGLQGQGQTIAIVSFASFRQSDVDEFDRLAGVQSSPVERVRVNGGSTETTTQNSGEVNLDIDVVRGLVPKAHIINYEAPLTSIRSFTTGVSDVIDRIVQDGRANIVSMSWGLCDVPQLADGTPWLSSGDRLRVSQSFQAAVAQGMSVFVASGDAGAFGCQRFDLGDHRLAATWPGDDPNVVSVGGTLLSVRSDGNYLEETGWEDLLQAAGGGGGLNPVDPRPGYQEGLGVDNKFSNGKRQFPDVAAAADPDSGFFAVTPNPRTGQPEPNVVGGTSAATPFWAASMVLVQQFAQQQGVDKLGFLNPLFYRIASSSQDAGAFHDVVLGGNRFHNCTPGWDFSTGLGSPDVGRLAQAIVAQLKAQPAA